MKLPEFPAFVSLVHALELYDMAEACFLDMQRAPTDDSEPNDPTNSGKPESTEGQR